MSSRPEELATFATVTQILYVLSASVALTGLLTYLWYLYRGARAERAIAAFYSLVFVAAAWSILTRGITGFESTPWGATARYARDHDAQVFVELAFFALYLLPQVAGAIAYLSLRRATTDPTARKRILVVGSALLIWMGASLLSAIIGVQYDPRVLLGLQAVDVAAVVAIVIAFREPRPQRSIVAVV